MSIYNYTFYDSLLAMPFPKNISSNEQSEENNTTKETNP